MGYLERGDGRRIYFEDYQGAGRPFLLIHGWAMSGRIWDGALGELTRRGHRVVTFDQRGCGLSDKDFADTSVAASITDAVALATHLGLFGVIVNGWSLGGAVAAGAAAALGGYCGGLVLTCGASPRYTRAQDFPYGGTSSDVDAMLKGMALDRASFFHGVSRSICARRVGAAVEDWMWSLFMQSAPSVDFSLLDLTGNEQRRLLSELVVPILSIVGNCDNFVPPEIGESAAKLAKDGTLIRFDDCGHAPFIEYIDKYIETVTMFSDKIDGMVNK